MNNSEYQEIINRLGLTRAEFARRIGISHHGVYARCAGKTRITAKTHLQILEFAVAHLLRMKISGPAPRMKHAREVPAEFEMLHRRVTKSRPARSRLPHGTSSIEARTCAAPGCQLPVEALPGARLCPQHGQDATFMGWRRFE